MEQPEENEIQEGKPNRADIHEASTTQGGSDFGQGSSQLGKKANKQGGVAGAGSNYGNEAGWNNEALRTTDIEKTSENPDKP